MVRSYEDATEERRARLGSDAESQRSVVEQAYEIAMQVAELREQHSLTQVQLAERCGMDPGDISRIERGSTNPTARTLQRNGEALDADLRLVARAS